VIGRGGFGKVSKMQSNSAGVEGSYEEGQPSLRYEGDVQGKNSHEEFCCFCNE
jgi:hypothetical protein